MFTRAELCYFEAPWRKEHSTDRRSDPDRLGLEPQCRVRFQLRKNYSKKN